MAGLIEGCFPGPKTGGSKLTPRFTHQHLPSIAELVFTVHCTHLYALIFVSVARIGNVLVSFCSLPCSRFLPTSLLLPFPSHFVLKKIVMTIDHCFVFVFLLLCDFLLALERNATMYCTVLISCSFIIVFTTQF